MEPREQRGHYVKIPKILKTYSLIEKFWNYKVVVHYSKEWFKTND